MKLRSIKVTDNKKMLMKGKIFENFYRKKQILLMVITGIELNI